MILDKEKEIEKLNFDLSERGVETQRLAKQVREGDSMRS
jgi:hypothetical protein